MSSLIRLLFELCKQVYRLKRCKAVQIESFQLVNDRVVVEYQHSLHDIGLFALFRFALLRIHNTVG